MKEKKIPERVQERNVRAVAAQVVLVTAIALFFKLPVLMLLLCGDFILRAFISSTYSPLAFISRKIPGHVLPFRKRMILLKPKKFAASIGAVISGIAGIAGFAGYDLTMLIFTTVLLLFSFMEAFLKFCAGCWMFGILIRLNILSEEVCEDCSFDTEA